ncbi:MAG: SIMPL domain-containing protein [Neisseriaceae bacterium]|nr:SIMPL domain-containing protein [Neisseriaceae bacterium]MBQ9725213.1 SIMPL domain-containing protein [Neisseriaceae bacterium]MBR1819253.1 SIMPL domain-containing protein [Neisseriaceae bacterium]
MSEKSLLLPALVLAVGIAAGAGVLGLQLKNLRQPGEITVKGLAEENYQADSAEWKLSMALHYPDYATSVAGLKRYTPVLINFLKSQGFSDNEMRLENPQITVHRKEIYENDRYRYVDDGYNATQSVLVNTKDLSKLKQAYDNALNFRAEQIGFRFDEPQYLLGNLEEIKHSLIAKATQDAHRRAEEFAKTGNGKVGAMKSASQGSFNIYSDSIADNDDGDYGGTYSKSTVGKRVRLVVTVKYGID